MTIPTSIGRKLWRYMLLKALVPSYERMTKPSSKPSVAVSTMASTPPSNETPSFLVPEPEVVC